MRWGRLIASFTLFAFCGPAVASDTQPIFGYYNPKTRAFTPASPLPAAVTRIVRSGTLKINVNATVDGIPADQTILAFVSAYLDDATYQNSLEGSVQMNRSGATATASLTVPYIFVASSASETIAISVQLSTQAAPFPSSGLTVEIPLPADNATTVVTLPQNL
jgi:hypothetical protein